MIGIVSAQVPIQAREPGVSTATSPEAEKAAKAIELAADALRAESSGNLLLRQRLLSEAKATRADCPLVRAQTGDIRVAQQWKSIEDCVASAQADERVPQYEKRRASTPDSLAGHLLLGNWCLSIGLSDQAFGHFQRALLLDADNAVALRALGHQRIGNEWVSPEQIADMQSRSEQVTRSHRQYGEEFIRIRKQLESPREPNRESAVKELASIKDPLAVHSAEIVFNSATPAVASKLVDWLADMDAVSASRLLARYALMHPAESVRAAATEALQKRDLSDFVPEVISITTSPIVSSLVPVMNRDGTLAGYRQAFARETATENQLVVVDTMIRRKTIRIMDQESGFFRRTGGGEIQNQRIEASVERAARADAEAKVMVTQQSNLRTLAQNARIAAFLSTVSQDEIAPTASGIWKWWAEWNETELAKGRRYHREAIGHTVPHYVTYKAIDPPSGSLQIRIPTPEEYERTRRARMRARSLPQPRMDCLVAGTQVMTATGQRAIESITTGDLVLSQNVNSGELQWQPVIRSTTRPPEPIVELQTANGKLRSTGGHLYWVSGKGWIKARDVELGDILHGAKTPTVVCTKKDLPQAQTFNLHVARNANFFAGGDLVLTHDVTHKSPTRSLVPGLQLVFK